MCLGLCWLASPEGPSDPTPALSLPARPRFTQVLLPRSPLLGFALYRADAESCYKAAAQYSVSLHLPKSPMIFCLFWFFGGGGGSGLSSQPCPPPSG